MKIISFSDTIAAISTPPGEGGVGIIRVSGEKALEIARKFFRKPSGETFEKFIPRYAYFGIILDSRGGELDRGIGIYFRAPASYTGEDVFEFQLHGSPILLKRVLDEVLASGVRLAEPGEFTKRAFLNGKLDLVQAEAVIDLIQASSVKAMENARKMLEGELSKKLWGVRDVLKEILIHLETAIDFPEEDLEFQEYPSLLNLSSKVKGDLESLLDSYFPGRIYQYGVGVTIVGMPNVGKSHILNRLLKKERAIVSEIPGTTRDFIEERTLIAGIPLRLVDTAGLRETEDPVEKIGIDLTRKKIRESDLVIFVFDASREVNKGEVKAAADIEGKKRIVVINKMDIAKNKVVEEIEGNFSEALKVSAKTGEGIRDVEEKIREKVQTISGRLSSEIMLTSERQYRLVKEALESTISAIEEMKKNSPAEFVALEVRAALERIGELTGEFYNDELLREIFDRFCIGK